MRDIPRIFVFFISFYVFSKLGRRRINLCYPIILFNIWDLISSIYNWLWTPAANLPGVVSSLRFIKPLRLYESEKPFLCEFDVKHISGAQQTNIECDTLQVSIQIQDVRGLESKFTVERNGFEILQHESAIGLSDIAFSAETRQQYLKETERIIKDRFNAYLVSAFGCEVQFRCW